MLIRKKEKQKKGFLGAAKKTEKDPYTQAEKTPGMYPLGLESNFITPRSPEMRARCPKGIKR